MPRPVRPTLLLPLLALALAPAPAAAGACPPAPDIAPAMDALFAEVRAARSQDQAGRVAARMWAEWTRAPDERAQGLLDEGMARGRAGDVAGARAALEALTDYCPDYAEGWNQRAILAFLRADFPRALELVDRTLALDPRHVGALTGRGLTLLRMGRASDGHGALREALALNPWIVERRFLPERPEPVPQIDL